VVEFGRQMLLISKRNHENVSFFGHLQQKFLNGRSGFSIFVLKIKTIKIIFYFI